MIAGMAKAYNLPFDYVLHKMSYANMVLYSSVLPSYSTEKEQEETIDADDPENKELINQILHDYQ